MKFHIRVLLYVLSVKVLGRTVVNKKFTIYIFLYNVRISFYERQNIRVASFLIRKNAMIPKLGHKLGTVTISQRL